jgi:hypothetical protein
MSSPDAARKAGGIGLLLDWIDALRRSDLHRIAALLDPQVTWHGLTDDLACVGREEVLRVVEEQLPMCMRAEALELVVAPSHLILGTRNPWLPDPPGVELGAQIYNVFELLDNRIRTVRDFATRERALGAAGLDGALHWR